jgi:hypothetical protein
LIRGFNFVGSANDFIEQVLCSELLREYYRY